MQAAAAERVAALAKIKGLWELLEDARKSFPLLSSGVSMVTGQGSDRYSSYVTWANPISSLPQGS